MTTYIHPWIRFSIPFRIPTVESWPPQLFTHSVFLHAEFTLIGISSQGSLQQRRCSYHVTSKKSNFTTAGNVSGSVQLCKNTQCCVGYYVVISGQPKVDVLGEKIQPGTTGLDLKECMFMAARCACCFFVFFCCSLWYSREALPRYDLQGPEVPGWPRL